MTKVSGSGVNFSFLEEPMFEKKDGRISCRVRVRCDGIDSIVELELDGDEWRVVSDSALLDGTDVLDVLKDELSRSSRPPPKH